MKYCKYAVTFVALFAFFCFLILPTEAYAYLDPSAGSFIFQVIMATLLGVIFAIKIYWRKIKSLFADIFSKKQKDRKDNVQRKNSKLFS